MILLHIISKDEKQAAEIVDFLMEHSLILDAVMMEKVMVRKKGAGGKIETHRHTIILGKTKALLFVEIDKRLRVKYPDKEMMPVLYSIPIVNMDWEQVDELMCETARV